MFIEKARRSKNQKMKKLVVVMGATLLPFISSSVNAQQYVTNTSASCSKVVLMTNLSRAGGAVVSTEHVVVNRSGDILRQADGNRLVVPKDQRVTLTGNFMTCQNFHWVEIQWGVFRGYVPNYAVRTN